MKHLANSLLVLLFVLGVLVFPALHHTRCGRSDQSHSQQSQHHREQPGSTSHNSNDCVVCQLAAMPFISSPVLTGPCAVATRPVTWTPAITASSSSAFSLFDSPPTGPPAFQS